MPGSVTKLLPTRRKVNSLRGRLDTNFVKREEIEVDQVSDERAALLEYLAFQRASILSICHGISEPNWHRSVVPSGWTIAGIVEHLGSAERQWFLGVVDGDNPELPWDEGRPPYDPIAALVCDRPSDDVVAYYREQCLRSDEVLSGVAMSDVPKSVPEGLPSVRAVVLHMIEETAAHAGHLEIARELLDGVTHRGLR
jgi:hypothetical protein